MLAASLTLVTLGILGASLFYGDGMITPAISALSAVKGLKVAAPSLGSLVLPITVAFESHASPPASVSRTTPPFRPPCA